MSYISGFLDFVSGPFSGLVGTALAMSGGVVIYHIWRIISSILNPVSYVSKMYQLADKAIYALDDRIIDKIRNERIKRDIQLKLKNVLENRSKEIELLIKEIGD